MKNLKNSKKVKELFRKSEKQPTRIRPIYALRFEAFMTAFDEYIDYYNNKRIKSRLKGKSPEQYRTLSING